MAKQKFIKLFLLSFLFLLSCESKVFDNPFDSNATNWALNLNYDNTLNVVTLTWKDNVDGENGFKLYRKDTIINDEEITNKTLTAYKSFSSNTSFYIDTLSLEKNLYYRLYAYDETENLSARFAENSIVISR